MKIPSTLRGVAACIPFSLPLAVQAETPPDESGAHARLNPVVVTATLAPRTVEESLSSVTVIDEEALRRQDPSDLKDIFRGQPGVDVTSNGSFGKSGSVYIRGISNEGSVLLIDGIRLRSATTGGASWQYLEPRMFERAEIVRGPRSSLYGADAMGGVVQLFTREDEAEGVRPWLSLGGGNHGSARLSAGVSGASGNTRYSFAGSHFDTDGAPVRRDGEDKGYRNTSGLARLVHALENGAEIGGLGLHARGTTEYDGGEIDFVQQVAGIYGEVPVTRNWRSRLTLSEARDETDNYDLDGDKVGAFDTRIRTTRWENTVALGQHEIVAGAEHSRDRVAGTTDYAEDSRDNTAVFAQALLDFSPFSVQAGLRHDDNEAYGDELTGNLGLGYDLDGHHTLRASYGTAFRAPTFNDLYFPNSGNSALHPETSRSFEVGLRGQYQSGYWDAAVFRTKVDDLIAWAPGAGGLWEPQNVESARIQGIELSAGAELAGWTLQGAFTHLDPENRSDANHGNYLPRRATESLRLDVDRELGNWSLGGSLVAESRRYDDAANENRLSGYGLLNLRASWEFAPQWSARLTVDNVFDREYETAKDYINAGRTVFLSLNYGGW